MLTKNLPDGASGILVAVGEAPILRLVLSPLADQPMRVGGFAHEVDDPGFKVLEVPALCPATLIPPPTLKVPEAPSSVQVLQRPA